MHVESVIHAAFAKKIEIIRWLARASSVALFILWGSFFVAHLTEWFFQSVHFPPPWVWLAMAFHAMMLVSFLVALFRERAGALAILAFTLCFFCTIGVFRFIAPTITPAVLFLLASWLTEKKGGEKSPA